MRSFAATGFIIALALLTGCARARVTTEIRGGGAYTRTVALTGQEKKDGQMDMGGSIEESFDAPAGTGWKASSEKKDANITMTYVRVFAAGTPVKGDLNIKGGDAKPALVNEVTVTRLAPNRFEYRETLRWTGTDADSGIKMKPEEFAKIKAALPAQIATDANVRGIADKLSALAMPMMFGPNDPLLAIGILHPDLAARRASQKIGALMMKALEEQFGDKMTVAQRRDITLKLIEASLAQATPSKPDPSSGPPAKSGGAGLTPLMFVLRTPGKIISSNGELDQFTGEVYWAMFPPGAALKPVVLTAVVEVE